MTCFCLRTSYNLISHGKSETVSAIQEGPIGRFFLMLPRKFPRYTDANGKKKVAGGPGLKQTQLYTAEFGRAIAAWWRAHGPVSTGTGSLPLQTDNVVSSCFLRESMGTCSHDFWWTRNSKTLHPLQQEGAKAMVSCSTRWSVSACPLFSFCGKDVIKCPKWDEAELQTKVWANCNMTCSVNQPGSSWGRQYEAYFLVFLERKYIYPQKCTKLEKVCCLKLSIGGAHCSVLQTQALWFLRGYAGRGFGRSESFTWLSTVRHSQFSFNNMRLASATNFGGKKAR